MSSDDAIGCFVAAIVIFIIVAVIAIAPAIHFSSLGTGKHTGFVTAVEQSGWFFPNYQVYVKTDNSSSQEDVYCINRSNPALAEKAKEYSKQRKLVSVSFQGVRGFGYGLCHTQEITDISLDSD